MIKEHKWRGWGKCRLCFGRLFALCTKMLSIKVSDAVHRVSSALNI